MICRESVVELVECARAGELPGAELQSHMRECSRCRERWEDEQRLSSQFHAIRHAAAACQPSNTGRDQLMLEFERAHHGGLQLWMRWALNAAAVALVVIALVHDWRVRHPGGHAGQEARVQPEPVSGNAAEDSGFVDVPYALPLVPGEFVSVIRTELAPAALARMGVDVDPVDGAEVPAELLLGEDGSPRAVRLLPDTGVSTFE